MPSGCQYILCPSGEPTSAERQPWLFRILWHDVATTSGFLHTMNNPLTGNPPICLDSGIPVFAINADFRPAADKDELRRMIFGFTMLDIMDFHFPRTILCTFNILDAMLVVHFDVFALQVVKQHAR